MCPSNRPIGGIKMSSTNDDTIFPNAAPIATPTARSITLPRIANSLNSLSISFSLRFSSLILHHAGAGILGLRLVAASSASADKSVHASTFRGADYIEPGAKEGVVSQIKKSAPQFACAIALARPRDERRTHRSTHHQHHAPEGQ